MSEIIKLYKNAGIEKEFEKPAECVKNPYISCDGCMLYDDKKGKCNNQKDYPPFTAEKQIELIKWLGKLDGKLEITCTYNKEKFIFYFYFNKKTDKNPDPKYPYSNFLNADIEILIASIINDIWQDLTEEERKQIKEILE